MCHGVQDFTLVCWKLDALNQMNPGKLILLTPLDTLRPHQLAKLP